MDEFQKIEFNEECRNKYWNGVQNRFVRYYTYLAKGNGLVNEFKYYIIFVFGGYWTIRVTTIMGYQIPAYFILLLGILGVPVLMLIGHWHLHRAQKPIELVTTFYGSLTRFNGYNMQITNLEQQQKIIELLQRILAKIEHDNKKL